MMSRKHYQAFAAMLRDSRRILGPNDTLGNETISAMEDRMCDLFADDNPAFDVTRFRLAAQ